MPDINILSFHKDSTFTEEADIVINQFAYQSLGVPWFQILSNRGASNEIESLKIGPDSRMRQEWESSYGTPYVLQFLWGGVE